MVNEEERAVLTEKNIKRILRLITNPIQNLLLKSVVSSEGIFDNKELEESIRERKQKKKKLTKAEIVVLLKKGELSVFDELNVELNLKVKEY